MNRSFFIAGVQFRPLEAKEEIKKLLKNQDLILESEPENKFDPNAVKIISLNEDGKCFLGYVPKKFSAEVSAILEVGINLECIVEEINPSAKPWEMCKVIVKDIIPETENDTYEENSL
jgi:hypothetical protein